MRKNTFNLLAFICAFMVALLGVIAAGQSDLLSFVISGATAFILFMVWKD